MAEGSWGSQGSAMRIRAHIQVYRHLVFMKEPFGISEHIPNRIFMRPCNLKLITEGKHYIAGNHLVGFKEGV